MTFRFLQFCYLLLLCSVLHVAAAQAADEPKGEQTVKLRVTGLFQPDRAEDFRTTMLGMPEVTVVSLEYETTEAEFRFDLAKAFPNYKQSQLIEAFNNKLNSISQGTFGVRTLSTVPADKLTKIEIPIYGLDCKACSYVAY